MGREILGDAGEGRRANLIRPCAAIQRILDKREFGNRVEIVRHGAELLYDYEIRDAWR
jgi:hypothetical protein